MLRSSWIGKDESWDKPDFYFFLVESMIGKSFKYNGQELNKITAEREVLAEAERRKLNTSDESKKIDWRHGVRLSPTFQRGRKIEIKGIVLTNSREGASKAMDWLDQLFVLQEQGGKTEFKPFTVIDEQDRERIIPVKIKTPIEYDTDEYDYIDGDWRTFRVVLEAEDARLFSSEEKVVIGKEWTYGGFKLGVKLWKPLNIQSKAILCKGEGNMEAPLRIVITVQKEIHAPLRIQWGKKFFALNIPAQAGDTIIIDTKKRTATKNGENILAIRVAGSQRPTIKGEERFLVSSLYGGLQSAFEVKIYFANVML